MKNTNQRLHLVLIFLVSSLILFYRLGDPSLKALDEAKWAQISSEMLKGNDWLVPHIAGRVFAHKPALRMWLNSVSFAVFGNSEFALRFWSAVSGIGIIILTYMLSFVLYRDTPLSFGSSLILIFSPYFTFEFLRVGHEHCTFTFFFLFCLYSFLKSRNEKKYFYLSSVFFGLAFLTYGFAALFAPLVIVVYILISGELANYRFKDFSVSLLIASAIILPWYILQFVFGGVNFLKIYLAEALYFFNVDWFYVVANRLKLLDSSLINYMFMCADLHFFRGPGYYLNVIKIGFYPWWISAVLYMFFLIFKIPAAFRGKIKIAVKKEDLFIAAWLVCMLGVLCIFKNKAPWRIYLMFPVFSIFAVKALAWFYKEAKTWAVAVLAAAVFFTNPFILQPVIQDHKFGAMEIDTIADSEMPLSESAFGICPGRLFEVFRFFPFLVSATLFLYSAFFKKRHLRNIAFFIMIFYCFFIGAQNTVKFFKYAQNKSDIDEIVWQIEKLNPGPKEIFVFDPVLHKMKNGIIIPEYSRGGFEGGAGSHRWDTFFYLERLGSKKEYFADFVRSPAKENSSALFLFNIVNWQDIVKSEDAGLFRVLISKGEYILAAPHDEN